MWRAVSDRQQVGHLIAPPLFPLKSHRAPADNTSQRLFLAVLNYLKQQTCNKPQKHTNCPKASSQSPRAPGGAAEPARLEPMSHSPVSTRGPDGTAPQRLQHVSLSTEMLQKLPDRRCRCAPRCPSSEARLGTQEGLLAPPGFIMGGRAHHHHRALPLARRGGGTRAANHEPAELHHSRQSRSSISD